MRAFLCREENFFAVSRILDSLLGKKKVPSGNSVGRCQKNKIRMLRYLFGGSINEYGKRLLLAKAVRRACHIVNKREIMVRVTYFPKNMVINVELQIKKK